MQSQLMIQNIALAGKIKVGVVCEIHNCRFVSRCRVLDPEIAFHQRVLNDGGQVSGESLFAIFAEVSQLDTVWNFLSLPNHIVERMWPAMKSIFPIILGQG